MLKAIVKSANYSFIGKDKRGVGTLVTKQGLLPGQKSTINFLLQNKYTECNFYLILPQSHLYCKWRLFYVSVIDFYPPGELLMTYFKGTLL